MRYAGCMTQTEETWRWPFVLGDKVTCRGNWGPLCTDLRVHSQENPGAVYEVCETKGDGRWIALRDQDGHVYAGEPWNGYGHTYFRIASECGEHVPTYRSKAGGWLCARCDEPLPGSGR